MKLNDIGRKNTNRINQIMESRFGFSIDFDNMEFRKAYRLVQNINESLDQARKTHGIHTAEKNPKYMELLLVREGLHQWMLDNRRRLFLESEMAKSEAILAAKDMVDSLQDMLEKISKMQNEQLPALLDTIRDQISSEKAQGFKTTVAPLLQQLIQTLQKGRETADGAARNLAGEAMDQPMDMDTDPNDAEPEVSEPTPPGAPDSEREPPGDDFAAVDAAAGGPEALGRGRR